MCGIAGFYSKNGDGRNDHSLIKKMTDIIAHRGPDAEGQWSDGIVTLGHRRLAIIDLSESGNQPMVSNDGNLVISYNGEVYNYIEIRKKLEKEGVVFRTKTDTEVILEAYRVYGTECFNKFNGMWSLAIYDISKRCIVLSRDRFGVKPLYYVNDGDNLIFASEAKAILAAFPKYGVPNPRWIYRYLSHSGNEDIDDVTAYELIKNFPPASYGIYGIDDHILSIDKYWEVDEKAFYTKWIRGKNPYKTFRELFESAVGLRLRSDVEVGACLSGGIDSSSIVGCISKKYKKKVHTFSSIYKDKDCNEEPYIRRVNERWGSIPHYVMPDDDKKKLDVYFRNIEYHHDSPTGGASLYSQYKVMQLASEKVKVLLDGQGADELFAGYIPYYSDYIDDVVKKNSIFDRLKAIKLITIFCKEWPKNCNLIATDTVVNLVGIDGENRFRGNNSDNAIRTRRTEPLFTDSFLDKVDDKKYPESIKLSTSLGSRLCNDVITHSIPALVHNEDGNSMAFSIESRIPFLDYRIVEFAIALDGKYKIRNGWTKWIIRKSLREYLPKKVYKRKNKMGFPAPFARWLREGCCEVEFKTKIYDFAKRGIVPFNTVDRYYNEHMHGESDHNEMLFRIYNLEVWMEGLETV